jgi:hydroxymethylpyrimidine pyrophosphatase-like HAD family hydrolase
MKLAAIALDFDGTSAVNDVFDPAVRAAVGEARRHGIYVLLVTGRRLPELARVAGDLSCFDVVVAENGAVLEFPASGRHVRLGHAPSDSVVAEIQRCGVHIDVGESVIEADASAAVAIVKTIRELEQPLVLAFNRGRLMVLPQATAKSTGLKQALFALRVSIHNTVGIGDAENDHDLLDACEVGVAVEWGSAPLRAVADEVIAGAGPPAVADYIRRIAQQPRLSAAQMGRRRLLLGHEHGGEPVSLAVRGRTILIAGEPGSGKSWLAGLLCEQLILQGYCVCVLDPEGDYRSLEGLPGVILLGGDDPPPHARALERALRHPDVSVVVDLSKMPHHEKREYMRGLLRLLAVLRRRTGLPHKILLDEAHYFLGESRGTDLIDSDLAGYILITYRISALDEAVRCARDSVVIVTRETDPHETDTLRGLCRPHPDTALLATAFGDLRANQAALLPGSEESHGEVRRFQLAPRLTSHVRHRTKYLDMPVADAHAFVFTIDGHPGARARTLRAFMGMLAILAPDALDGHLRRHDFSRWVDHVFRDRPLAAHVRQLESRLGDEEPRLVADAVSQAIRARYEPVAA